MAAQLVGNLQFPSRQTVFGVAEIIILTHEIPLPTLAFAVGRSFLHHVTRNSIIQLTGISMKFCLVDRITELVPGSSIATIKNVSLAEEYLQDHFPGFSVLPGVMMVECMVQSCAWLLRATDEFRHSTILLKEARAVKFNSFLKPGQTLHVTAELKKNEDDTATFKAAGTVEGQSAVSARITLSKLNLADTNPEMAATDERMQAAARELFAQIVPDSLTQP